MAVVADEWTKLEVLDEDDMMGVADHPFPKEGTAIGKTLEEAIASMEKDESIPLTEIGPLEMEPGETKSKRFTFVNDKGHKLKLEVFSSVPALVQVTTSSLTVPFN